MAIAEIRHWTLDAETAPDVYVPLKPFSGWFGLLGVAVRHRGPASAVAGAMRQAVWDIDPNLPIGEMVSMEDRISRSITGPRFFTLLLATFAGIAFLLAAGGIYGSMLYSVARRQRELGIRLALGARAADIVKMVLSQGMILVGVGLTIGIAGSLAFSRLLESLVFGITTTDAATFGVVAVALAMVAMAACYLPARRAGSTDPLQTIRAE